MSDKYKTYEDWYDNGPGSESFNRSCRSNKVKSFFALKWEAEPELHYLRWVRENSTYIAYMNKRYEEETGKKVPEEWR